MKEPKKRLLRGLKTTLTLVINVVILIVLIEVFGSKGLWGIMVMIIGFAAYRLVKSRQQFLTTLRYIETMIFGKPLDRDMWNKGEFKKRKKRKIKLVWRKKDGKKRTAT